MIKSPGYMLRRRRPLQCAICKSYRDIENALKEDKIALLITMEGAEPLGKDLDLLRAFYELGVR